MTGDNFVIDKSVGRVVPTDLFFITPSKMVVLCINLILLEQYITI